MGDSSVRALPAHFMHSVGNFSFYDPVSRILFSGDVGASIVPSRTPYAFVDDFETKATNLKFTTFTRVMDNFCERELLEESNYEPRDP